MSRTTLTPVAITTPYATTGVAFVYTAGNVADGNDFASTGREILIARNTDSGPHTVTVASVADTFGRLGDITADSIAAGAFHVYQIFPQLYWAQTGNKINVNVSDATIELAVLKLPATLPK